MRQQADNDGLSCQDCRARHEEADTDPECDETGHPCALMQVELLPENITAWNLFWDVRHTGHHVLDLYHLDLDSCDASDLLLKLRVLSEEVLAIEAAKQKEQEKKMQQMRRGR